MSENFAQVLQSFTVTGAEVSAKEREPAVTYITWQGLREQAFSLGVPSKCRTSGGLFRLAPVETHAALEEDSPDGQIRLTRGDANIPPFAEPWPVGEMLDFREGSWYSPDYGVNMMVRRYVPGTDFTFAGTCSNLTITDACDRPGAVKAINAIYARYGPGMSVRLRAGEVAFACQRSGRAMQGYYLAGTRLARGYGVSLWSVEELFGYLAPVEQSELAQLVLSRTVQSIQINSRWLVMQQGIVAKTSQIVAQTGQAISKLITDSYWQQQNTLDEIGRRCSNPTLGVVDVIDSVTGRELKVGSGSNYY